MRAAEWILRLLLLATSAVFAGLLAWRLFFFTLGSYTLFARAVLLALIITTGVATVFGVSVARTTLHSDADAAIRSLLNLGMFVNLALGFIVVIGTMWALIGGALSATTENRAIFWVGVGVAGLFVLLLLAANGVIATIKGPREPAGQAYVQLPSEEKPEGASRRRNRPRVTDYLEPVTVRITPS